MNKSQIRKKRGRVQIGICSHTKTAFSRFMDERAGTMRILAAAVSTLIFLVEPLVAQAAPFPDPPDPPPHPPNFKGHHICFSAVPPLSYPKEIVPKVTVEETMNG